MGGIEIRQKIQNVFRQYVLLDENLCDKGNDSNETSTVKGIDNNILELDPSCQWRLIALDGHHAQPGAKILQQ